MTRSPSFTSERDTTSSFPPRSTVTVSGASERSFSTSLPVRRLLLSSSHFPSVTSVTIIAADSKKSVGCSGVTIAMTRLYTKETAAPSVTRVSMFGTRLNAARTPLAKKE